MYKPLSIVLLSASTFCFGDTLQLKSGENVDGVYLGGTARTLRMEINGQVQTFDVGSVAGLQFNGAGSGGAPPPPPPPPQYNQNQQAQPNNQQAQPNQQYPPPQDNSRPAYSSSNNSQALQGPGTDLPSGTQLTVRMIDSVDSNVSHLGDTFRASMDEPVMQNGQVIVPRGADVVVKLVEDTKSGKIAGKTVLKLALVSMKVNDRMVDITTGDVDKESGSRGARSGKVIGGTAALGAIIGGIAGGGKGAAIGAGSGAAVGTGAQAVTKAQQVKIPSETRLVFTLSYAVRV